MKLNFSIHRLWAIIIKEFIQILRDKPTLGMMVGIPVLQMTLFGFAINTNPRDLPTAVLASDQSAYTRTYLKALENTQYFKFVKITNNEMEAKQLLDAGKVLFVITIPPKFTYDLLNQETPQILVEADATDPVATSTAVGVLRNLSQTVLNYDLKSLVTDLQSTNAPFELVLHEKYNPEAITSHNIVPALLGVALTMTMVFITALAITRERDQGTMENLLSTPLKPLEIIIGKIIPYIIIGYCQVLLILLVGYTVFDIPLEGSLILLLAACLPFIFANLSVGLTLSTLARNPLQAIQGSIFFFLPSILLSGFMFPFAGMPKWAQWIGNVLPLTHFIRIVRGILLKGNDISIVLHSLWPILLFTVIVVAISLKRFRKTLD